MEELSTMTKKELIKAFGDHQKRLSFRCIHGHTGYSHRNCYDQAKGVKNKIGFFDIETSDLLADWGLLLSYCIKHEGGGIIKRCITPEEVTNSKVRDRRLVEMFAEDVKLFDTLVVFYGKDTGGRYQRHDIPFMRTRFEHWRNTGFPKQSEISIVDIYDTCKSKFKLKRNSMQHVCNFLGITNKTTPHDFGIWQKARDGNAAALRAILKHNVGDVITTEELYKRVYHYRKVRVLI